MFARMVSNFSSRRAFKLHSCSLSDIIAPSSMRTLSKASVRCNGISEDIFEMILMSFINYVASTAEYCDTCRYCFQVRLLHLLVSEVSSIYFA